MKASFPSAALLVAALSSTSCSHPSLLHESMSIDGRYLQAGTDRSFDIRYEIEVKDVPAGTGKLRLWWPVPRDSTLQTISGIQFSGPAVPRIEEERRFGNRIAFIELQNPPPSLKVGMTFRVKRREARVDVATLDEGSDPPGAFDSFLREDRLVVIDDQIRKLAEDSTRGREGTVPRARAIYDRVRERMTYDKSGAGWGRGDSRFACTVGKGNCTDFHALFIAMTRAVHIPSGFEIGLYLPYEVDRSGEWKPGTGYHCWAEFRVPGRTWVPVDASEGDKVPERSDYFFGGFTSNRVALSVGRDLVLSPPQTGEPLNYFLEPYCEIDGQPHPAARSWSYRDRPEQGGLTKS
jgi:transglutaminase-like putative cysteine protease